nr:hypothetical protein [Bacillus sp. REN3]
MTNEILTKDYVIQNGIDFEEELGFGGPFDQGIVEYTDSGEERLFTGLAYELYKNGNIESYFFVENGVKQGINVTFYPSGNIKRISNMDKGAAHGYQVEYFENKLIKYESECVAGREMKYIKYDEKGNIVKKRNQMNQI